jgi:hypothetical protein
MNAPDLDLLRQRWGSASARIDANLHLDVAAMRSALAGGTRQAVRAQLPCLLLELALDVVLVVALLLFAVHWRGDTLYLLAAIALIAIPLASLVVGIRQWRTMATLDYAAPVMQLRGDFERLRLRRIRLAQAILFVAVPLWWPAVAVLFMGLFGVDLLRGLPGSLYSVSFALGAVVIVVSLIVGGWLARRYGTRPGYQDFLDDVAGLGWRRLRGRLDAQHQFETDLHGEGAAAAPRARQPRPPLPAAAAMALRALKRRLLASILVFATLVLLNGSFNALQGGHAQFVAAGVLLNFAWIAQMVAAILHRSLLGRFDTMLPPDALARRVDSIAGWHRRIVQRTLLLAPMLGLLAAQVLGKVAFDADLMGLVGMPVATAAAAIAGATSAWLWRRRRRAPDSFAARAVELLTLGSAARARALVAALAAGDSRPDSEPQPQRAQGRASTRSR